MTIVISAYGAEFTAHPSRQFEGVLHGCQEDATSLRSGGVIIAFQFINDGPLTYKDSLGSADESFAQ